MAGGCGLAGWGTARKKNFKVPWSLRDESSINSRAKIRCEESGVTPRGERSRESKGSAQAAAAASGRTAAEESGER